jgi:hypothetical protein
MKTNLKKIYFNTLMKKQSKKKKIKKIIYTVDFNPLKTKQKNCFFFFIFYFRNIAVYIIFFKKNYFVFSFIFISGFKYIFFNFFF